MGTGSSKLSRSIRSNKNSKKGKGGMPARSMSFPQDVKTKSIKESENREVFGNGDTYQSNGHNDNNTIAHSSEQTGTSMAKPYGRSLSLTLNGETQNGDGIVISSPVKLRCSEEFCNTLTASELYNLMTAETWQGLPQIHDAGYMLLLDCRDKTSFEALHIVTARHHSALYSEYGLLLPTQLKLFHMIILYSSSSCTNLPGFSKKLAEDQVEHYILQSGCLEFLSLYPFLGSSQPLSFSSEMRKTLQTMPSEIIPGLLYQGNAKHALDSYIVKSLGITHIVNVTLEHPNRFEDTVEYMRIQLDDKPHVDLQTWLPKTSEFIRTGLGDGFAVKFSNSENTDGGEEIVGFEDKKERSKGAVLVHCNLGRSRSSTVVLGYLMQAHKCSLGAASRWLKDCRPSVRPNVGFLEQLLSYEKQLFDHNTTQLNDLPF